MIVRNSDNTFRTPTWEDRKMVIKDRKIMKYYEPLPYNVTDDSDEISIQQRPPTSFAVKI